MAPLQVTSGGHPTTRISVSGQTRKLLIVEDDVGLLNQLKWCFEGYDVVTAEDRSEAIVELRRNAPMVV